MTIIRSIHFTKWPDKEGNLEPPQLLLSILELYANALHLSSHILTAQAAYTIWILTLSMLCSFFLWENTISAQFLSHLSTVQFFAVWLKTSVKLSTCSLEESALLRGQWAYPTVTSSSIFQCTNNNCMKNVLYVSSDNEDLTRPWGLCFV